MEFITSSRGAPKLCFDSFTYTKKKSSKTTITWECSQRRTLECKGAVITDSPATEIRSSREHNHEKDDSHVGGLKVRKEIQLSVQANRGWPGQIIADKMFSQPVENLLHPPTPYNVPVTTSPGPNVWSSPSWVNSLS
ncbi:uncharacterized protein LOC128208457 [Mya arenaria]|uniref:uncharacterized protein LOC128208457 n=1 Tax=Mya arenaria TaxID=6604 RepID=UPI0022E111E7|nr:uncharacterized protein LOC128208457 [Mya arenaria]